MAGYNGRLGNEGDTLFQNATSINNQALKQRSAINVTNGSPLNEDEVSLGSVSGMGISRDQTLNMFPRFDGALIMREARAKFLTEVEASNNPDFTASFNPTSMKNFETIIDQAEDDSDVIDSPSFGLGPNMKAQDIDNVIKGNIVAEENIRPELPGKKGFGWYSDSHKKQTIGEYFNKKYSFANQDEEGRGSEDAIKGERIGTDAINYTQTYNQ